MGHLGAMLGHLGAMLSHLGVMLGDLGAMLGLCWAILGLLPCSCLGSADIGFAESNTVNVHRSGRTAAILDPFVVSTSAPCKRVIIGNLLASK